MTKKSLEATSVDHMDIDGLGKVKPEIKVVHPLFGKGVIKVLFVFPDGMRSVGVEFVEVGYKALVPEYAKLKLDNDA